MSDQASAAIIGALIVGSVALIVGILSFISTMRIHRQTAQIQAQTNEFRQADLHSSEAISLRSSLEEQVKASNTLRVDLHDCQMQHLTAIADRNAMDLRVKVLENDNEYLRRQMDGWLRREQFRDNPPAPDRGT